MLLFSSHEYDKLILLQNMTAFYTILLYRLFSEYEIVYLYLPSLSFHICIPSCVPLWSATKHMTLTDKGDVNRVESHPHHDGVIVQYNTIQCNVTQHMTERITTKHNTFYTTQLFKSMQWKALPLIYLNSPSLFLRPSTKHDIDRQRWHMVSTHIG